MKRKPCRFPVPIHVFTQFALFLVLLVRAAPAQAAISAAGNVQPAYPGANPDPWNVGDGISVGDSTNGTLSITGGSDVLSSGGTAGFEPSVTGTITVSGSGSTWTNSQSLVLGVFGTGRLEVLAGAQVANQVAFVGQINNGNGQILVSGAGSQWDTAQELFIGNSGTGSLTIQQQGLARSDSAIVAVGNTSTGGVTIDGQQSTWEVTNSLSVGAAINGGTASLALTGAGSRVYVGAAAVAQGAALPIDQTAIVVSKVGSPAQLSIYEGNSIQNAGSAYIGVENGEAGEAIVNGVGTTWSNSGGVFIGVNGSGTLSLVGGGTVSSSGQIAVGPSGVVTGIGTVIGELANAGLVQPGQSVGDLAVTGDYSQAATGKLQVELTGTPAGAFDTIEVSDQATLDGTLDVDLGLNGGNPFVPQLGDSFAILTAAGGVAGSFASAELPALAAGKMWQIRYSANAATLVVKLAGDYNDNGVVDAADYTIWRDNLGSTFDPSADGDTNGVVDLNDYNIWKANFGANAGAGAGVSAAAVPEPSTAFSFVSVVGTLLVAVGRRR